MFLDPIPAPVPLIPPAGFSVATLSQNIKSANDSYSPDEIELELADACERFHYNPLGWARWAFDWGYGELSGFNDLDEWQISWLDWYGQQLRLRCFNGRDAVTPIRALTASGHGIGKSRWCPS